MQFSKNAILVDNSRVSSALFRRDLLFPVIDYWGHRCFISEEKLQAAAIFCLITSGANLIWQGTDKRQGLIIWKRTGRLLVTLPMHGGYIAHFHSKVEFSDLQNKISKF